MKKGLIAVVLVAVLAAGGAGGYTVYQKKVAEKKYEQDMTKTISSLPAITVYEKEDLPSVEEEFKGTESNINIDSITPDISGVHTSEPGEYDVKYTFKDSHGTDRTATVKCTVKPELASHVEGMQDIEIDKGDELPTESGCTFDDYVSSVTLNTDEVHGSWCRWRHEDSRRLHLYRQRSCNANPNGNSKTDCNAEANRYTRSKTGRQYSTD